MDASSALPIVGTISLAAGLLMPIRDGRYGRRASISDGGPVRARFGIGGEAAAAAAETAAETAAEPVVPGEYRPDALPGGSAASGSHEYANAEAASDGDPRERQEMMSGRLRTHGSDASRLESIEAGPAAPQEPLGAIHEPSPARATSVPTTTSGASRPLFPSFDDRPIEPSPSAVPVRFARPAPAAELLGRAVPDGRANDAADDARHPGDEDAASSPPTSIASPLVEPPRSRPRRWFGDVERFFRRTRTSEPSATLADPPTNASVAKESDARGAFEDVLASLRGTAPPITPVQADDGRHPANASEIDSDLPAGHESRRSDGMLPVATALASSEIAQPAESVSLMSVAIVTSKPRHAVQRAIPLTRLPLRPVVSAASWTEQLDPAEVGASADRRLTLLRQALHSKAPALPPQALLGAWKQERGESRTLALRLLARSDHAETRTAARDALASGTEDERAVAIDALAACGALGEIELALGDRSDTIVARAALALTTSRSPSAFRARLERHLDPSRCEAVLSLLGGVLE